MGGGDKGIEAAEEGGVVMIWPYIGIGVLASSAGLIAGLSHSWLNWRDQILSLRKEYRDLDNELGRIYGHPPKNHWWS